MKKILILEDDELDREILIEKIKFYFPHVSVVLAEGKKQIISRLEDPDIGLVISDYLMPEFSGMQALTLCQEKYPHLPFVFVTGTIGSEEMAAETVLSGASGFLLKDNLNKLKSIIERVAPGLVKNNDFEINDISRRTLYLLKLSYDTFRKVDCQISHEENSHSKFRSRLILVKDCLNTASENLEKLSLSKFSKEPRESR